MNQSCLNCGSFTSCLDPLKSHGYSCTRWKQFVAVEQDFVTRLFEGDLSTREDILDLASSDSQKALGKSLIRRSYSSGIETDEDRSMELDLTSHLDEILRPDRTVLADLRVDDRDLQEAANFHEYCYSKDGPEMKLFARQLWIGIKLFHEYCRPCSKNKAAIDDILEIPVDQPEAVTDMIQLLEFGKCPKCGRTKLDLLRSRDLVYYTELAILLGQRAGKSTMTTVFASYLLHRFLKLQNPVRAYGAGMASNTVLTGTFVGLRFKDAMDLLWKPFDHLISTTPWFIEYSALLNFYEERLGQEIFKHKDTFIEYKHRNIFIYPSGPSKKTLRGRTRIFHGIDELDYFDFDEGSENKDRTSAKEVYNALDRSLLTIRTLGRKQITNGNYNIPTGYAFNLSSPASWFGFLTTLVRNHKDHSKSVLALNLATWEVNPTIPRSALDKDFQDNPAKALQDYGAIPPKGVNTFFTNEESIKSCFKNTVKNLGYEVVVRKVGSDPLLVKVSKVRRSNTYGAIPPSILALDAGYSNNSYASCTGHLNMVPTAREKVIISSAVEVIPEQGVSVVDYATIDEDMIYQIIEEKNVHVVLSDRWNSLSTLHRIRDKFPHVKILEYKMRYEDFVLVRSYVDSSAILMPATEVPFDDIDNLTFSESYPMCFEGKPMSHLFTQFRTVQDLVKTVGKGGKITDDLFRCVCLITTKLMDEAFIAKYMKNAYKKRGKQAPVVSGGVSSGKRTDHTQTTDGSRSNVVVSTNGRTAIVARR